MIDVFFCSVALEFPEGNLTRFRMAQLCMERWEDAGANLVTVTPRQLECDDREFQRRRRIYADQHAKAPIYICADDDALLPANFDIAAMVRLLESRMDFAVLSPLPLNATIQPWTPEYYKPVFDDDVMEHTSAGQVRFCRKGVIPRWPEMYAGPPAYDAIHGEVIRSLDMRIGYARKHSILHLGEGASTVWTA